MVFWGRKNHANLGIEKKNPQPEAYRRFVTVSCASVLLNGTDPSLWEKKPWINPITPGLKIPFCQSCFFSMNQSNYQNPQQESPSVPNCSTNNIGIEFCLAKNVKKKNIATMCLKVVCNVGIIFLQMVATWGPNQVKLHVEGLHCRICRSQQRSSNHQRSTRKNPPQKWRLNTAVFGTIDHKQRTVGFLQFPPPSTGPPETAQQDLFLPYKVHAAGSQHGIELHDWGQMDVTSVHGICLKGSGQKFHGFSKINKIKHPFQEAPSISWDSNLVQSIKSQKTTRSPGHQVKYVNI